MKIDENLVTSAAETLYNLGDLNNHGQDNDLTWQEAEYYARAVIQYLTGVDRIKTPLALLDKLRLGGYIHPSRARILEGKENA